MWLKKISISLGIDFWVDSYFPFSILKMLLHCILAYIISDEELSLFFIFVPLYVTCGFSLAAFKIFYLSLLLKNLIIICLGVVFFMFLMLGILWDSCISGFTNVIKFEIHGHFCKYFFSLTHSSSGDWLHVHSAAKICLTAIEVLISFLKKYFLLFGLLLLLCFQGH